MTLQGSKGVDGGEGGLHGRDGRGGRYPTAQLGAELAAHTMRNEQLDGAPWDLDVKLAELVLRAILP